MSFLTLHREWNSPAVRHVGSPAFRRGEGIAGPGAVLALSDAGYRFARIAGTSAGAILGILIAAYQRAGEDLHKIEGLMKDLGYTKFADGPFLERHTGAVGAGAELLWHGGCTRETTSTNG